MQSARVGEDHPVAQLVHVEWMVREINGLVDRQRKLIEKLQESRSDLTSAKIVLDSLIVTLTLHLRERDSFVRCSMPKWPRSLPYAAMRQRKPDQVGASKQRNAHTIVVASCSDLVVAPELVLFRGTPAL